MNGRLKRSLRLLTTSTSTASTPTSTPSLFQKQINNPSSSAYEFIKLSSKDIPERKDFQALNVLIRPVFSDLLNKINSKPEVVMIEGSRGTGKSVLMHQTVQHYRNAGWLVLYLPNIYDYITDMKSLEVGTGSAQGVVRSTQRPDMFSQPLGAQTILNNFVEVHGDKLSRLGQKRAYPHNLYKRRVGSSGEVDSTLLTIAQRGQRDLNSASDALLDLRLELSLVTEYSVLVAVDQINIAYWPNFFFSKGISIPTSKLLVPHTFRVFREGDGKVREELRLLNGVNLVATTEHYKLPSQLVGKRGEEKYSLLPFDKNIKFCYPAPPLVKTTRYSNEEFDVMFEQLKTPFKRAEQFEGSNFFGTFLRKKHFRFDKINSDYLLFRTLLRHNPEQLAKQAALYRPNLQQL